MQQKMGKKAPNQPQMKLKNNPGPRYSGLPLYYPATKTPEYPPHVLFITFPCGAAYIRGITADRGSSQLSTPYAFKT